MQSVQPAHNVSTWDIAFLQNSFQEVIQAVTTCIERIYTLCVEILRKIQNAPEEMQQFWKSFDQPSSIETQKRSKLHDQVRYKGWRELNNACLWHENEKLESLLQTSDVNEKDCDGATPLHAAALSGNLRAVKLLLNRGAAIEAVEIRGQTALHWAAYRGHVVVVNYLITQGANVNAKDLRDKTPLRMAAKYGHLETISSLLSHGADINVQDAKKQTPYFVAMLQGRDKVAHYLEEMGANTEGVNIDGKVAWDVAGRAGWMAFFRRTCVSDFMSWTQLQVNGYFVAICTTLVTLCLQGSNNR